MSALRPTLHEQRTKLKNAHEQLEVTLSAQKGYEEIFLTTSANNSDILQLLSKNFRVDYVSPSAWPITGYTPEEIVGRSCLDFIHPDDLSCALDAFFEIIETGQCDRSIEFRIRHKSGFYVPVEATGKHMEKMYAWRGLHPSLPEYDETERV